MNLQDLQQVICVIECPDADKLLQQFCVADNKDWWLPFDELMTAVSLCIEGKEHTMMALLEQSTGLPLFHPAHYGNDDFSIPLTSFVEALALAIKHAIPKLHPNKESIIAGCRYLDISGKWFVFEVCLQQPLLGEPIQVIHF